MAVVTMPLETAKNRMAFQKPDPATGIAVLLLPLSLLHCPQSHLFFCLLPFSESFPVLSCLAFFLLLTCLFFLVLRLFFCCVALLCDVISCLPSVTISFFFLILSALLPSLALLSLPFNHVLFLA
jgi:hypothetical protein